MTLKIKPFRSCLNNWTNPHCFPPPFELTPIPIIPVLWDVTLVPGTNTEASAQVQQACEVSLQVRKPVKLYIGISIGGYHSDT